MEEEEEYSNGAATPTATTKKRKTTPSADTNTDTVSTFSFFDELTDDLALEIISKLGSTASCPAHFFNLLLTSKRMNKLGVHETVLSKMSPKVFTCRAKDWGKEAIMFMSKCVFAMNVEAIYTLGMIMFYIYGYQDAMKRLIAMAAKLKHPAANYAMAIIQFNRSGARENVADELSDAELLSALESVMKAAFLDHVDAIREVGYIFIDGNGVQKDVAEGRRMLIQADAREVFSMVGMGAVGLEKISIPVPKSSWLASDHWLTWVPRGPRLSGPVSGLDLAVESKFGWDVPESELHPANRFLIEWFESGGGNLGNELRLCSNARCGRPESRKNEFFECQFCVDACYCSRVCQTMDWRRHHLQCNGDDDYYTDDNYYTDTDDDEENDEEDIEADAIQEEEVAGEDDLQDQEEQI